LSDDAIARGDHQPGSRGGTNMSLRTNVGSLAITGDNGQVLSFNFNNLTYAIGWGNEPATWFETVKYAHRNQRTVSITDDDASTKYNVNGNPAFIPIDLHDA
jgi:hypothetical protein